MAIVLEADQQGDGPTTSQTGAAVHSRKLFTWRTTGTSGGQSLASTAHMGHEFTEREREVNLCCRKRSVAEFMQESLVFLLRVQYRRKESSRSLSHLLMSFL